MLPVSGCGVNRMNHLMVKWKSNRVIHTLKMLCFSLLTTKEAYDELVVCRSPWKAAQRLVKMNAGNGGSNTFLYLWEVWPKLLQEKSGAGQYISQTAHTLLKSESPRLVIHLESFICIADLPACGALTGVLSRGEINCWPKNYTVLESSSV